MGTNYNLHIAGAGGIGSYFLTNITDAICNNQLEVESITIYDGDILEPKNKLYTTYECTADQLNKKKSQLIAEDMLFRFDLSEKNVDVRAITDNCDISEFANSLSYYSHDIFISAVDGSAFRAALYKLSVNPNTNYKRGLAEKRQHWLDLRSEGDSILIFRNPLTSKENILLEPYFEDRKIENASCQRATDLADNRIQYGNRIVALIGLQYLVNICREIGNELIFERTFHSIR